MSPLISAPNRGYADYQRVENWDSGVLISFSGISRSVGVTSAIVDVSRYAYLGGSMQEIESQCSVLVQWFLDANGAIRVGQRTFVLTSLTTAIAQIRFPNLGPFVQVIVTPLGAVTYTSPVTLFGTNRVHPLEFIPRNPVLVDQQAVAINAGASAIMYPADYYAGPVQVYINPQFTTGQVRFEYLNGNGIWDIFTQFIISVATASVLTWVTQAGAWRAVVANQSGANGTFYLTLTPSTTGAT